MRKPEDLNDSPLRAYKTREGLRGIARDHDRSLGVEVAGAAIATPSKATLTSGLSASTNVLVQLQRSMASAECDAMNLEQANRSGDFNRASWAMSGLKRFIAQVPMLLAMVPRGTGGELEGMIHALVKRAQTALENGPKLSEAALTAADHGDFTQRRAELAKWRAKADGPAKEEPGLERRRRRDIVSFLSGTRWDTPASAAKSAVEVEAANTAPSVSSESSVGEPLAEAADVQDVATQGVADGGGAMPHSDAIARSFGPEFDISSLQAHIGGAAAWATDALGAHAYAAGHRIAFASAPDLHTAAHEATHAVLQMRGVAPAGGIGSSHDAFERHADAVADAVVAGKPAAPLLAQMTGSATATGSASFSRAAATPLPNAQFVAGRFAGRGVGHTSHAGPAVQFKKTASTVSAASETATPTPIAYFDQRATTKPFARDYVTADEYLSLWATDLLEVTMKNLGPNPPQPHARLRWVDGDNTIALITSNLDFSRKRFATDDRGLLLRLYYPLDLHALVDRYRDLRPPPAGHAAEGPLGTSAWQTAIGNSIAAEARPRLSEAIHRMGQRYVAAADALYSSGTRAEQAIKEKLATENAILPHAPLDYIVLLAMRDPNVVTYSPPTTRSPRETANNALRPLLITCMGAQDPTLWNVLRVDTPGATLEQVAALLFNRADDVTAHTYNADMIVEAAPYYILPKEWAATLPRMGGLLGPAAYEPAEEKKQREGGHYNPEAMRRAAAQAAPDPRSVLAESTLVDEIALAQNDHATHQAAGKQANDTNPNESDAASATMLSTDAVALIARGNKQLAYLYEVMAPWSLDKHLRAANEFLMRAQEKTRRSDVLNPSWSSLLTRHGRLLSQTTEQVASFVKENVKAATNSGNSETPVGRVLEKYARAAGAAHLVNSGSSMLAEAERARQGVLLATIELAVQSSGYAVSQERASEDQARHVDGGSLHLEDTQNDIRMRAAEMRNALVQGQAVDAGEAEGLILAAEENRLIASISTLKVQLDEFKHQADKGTLGFVPGVVQGTELLNMRLDAPFLIEELAKIHDYLKDGHTIIYGKRDPKDESDSSLPTVAARRLENLRTYVRGAHRRLEGLKNEQKIEQFLQRADKVLADQRWRVMIGQVAVLIGVGLVTGGVASFVGGAVRGAMMLNLAADAASLARTVRVARVLGTAAELATDATLSGVAQRELMGGDAAVGENIISNALTRFALSPIGRLTAGLGQVDKKALDAWQRVGHVATFVLGKGVQLSAEMVTGTAMSYAVHRIAAWKRGEQPSDEMVDSWLLQGAAFAVGRFLNGRLQHRMQQLSEYGQRVGRLPARMRNLADRAAQLERAGTPQEAIDLLLDHRHIVDDEMKLIAKLEKDGVLRAGEAKALRSDANADGNVVQAQGFIAIQARAVGLEPIVEGAGRWIGEEVEIMTMMDKARSLGLDVELIQRGNAEKRWRVRFGAEILEFHERVTATPKTTADLSPEELAAVRLHADMPPKTSAGRWVDELRAQLNAEGMIKLEEFANGKTAQEVMDAYYGDFDTALNSLGKQGTARVPDTADRFTVGTLPKFGEARWKYLEDPAHWKPERAALHEQLLADARVHARAFADTLVSKEPTLYAMRGNTAAGKTRAVSGNVPELAVPMQATSNFRHRAVNPDSFKADLIKATPGATSSDVHSESSMLAGRFERELLDVKTADGKPASMLIDKRLLTVEDVRSYAELAKSSGRKFVLFDVDAPLEHSLAGVLERTPGGTDPLPPFEIVANGFKAVRNNRAEVMDLFANDPSIGTYHLYGTTTKGDRVKTAKIEDGHSTITNGVLYWQATEDPGDILTATRITNESADQLTRDFASDRATKIRGILDQYEGWTWKSALDAHSREKTP